MDAGKISLLLVFVFLALIIYLTKLFSGHYGWGMGLELLFVVIVALMVGLLYSLLILRFRK